MCSRIKKNFFFDFSENNIYRGKKLPGFRIRRPFFILTTKKSIKLQKTLILLRVFRKIKKNFGAYDILLPQRMSYRKKIPEHDRKKIFNKKPLFACVLAIQSRRLLIAEFQISVKFEFPAKINSKIFGGKFKFD